MKKPDQTLERLRHFLKLRGLSLTKERRQILQAALGMQPHFSVDDLFFAMRERDTKISKATLYRTIQLLVECRILRESALSGRQAVYEVAEPGQYHGHMVCTHCERMIEFSGPTLQKFIQQISLENQFLHMGAQIKLLGICEDCIRENPPSLRKQMCIPILKYAQTRGKDGPQ